MANPSRRAGLDKMKEHAYGDSHFNILQLVAKHRSAAQAGQDTHSVVERLTETQDVCLTIRKAINGALGGQSSANFALCAKVLDCTVKALFTLLNGERDGVPVKEVDTLRRLGECPVALELVRRINATCRDVTKGGNRRDPTKPNSSPALTACDKTCKNDVMAISATAKKLLRDFFELCEFPTMLCDESTGIGFKTSPCFMGMCGVSRVGWEWRCSFIGQANSAISKDLYDCVKPLLSDFSSVVFRRIRELTADGGSDLRSTDRYRGATARGAEGSNLIADFWRDGHKLLTIYDVCHIGNLALGIAIALLKCLIEHVRAMHAWFSKSCKRKLKLHEAHKDLLTELEKQVDNFSNISKDLPMKTVYNAALYCATRWLGLKLGWQNRTSKTKHVTICITKNQTTCARHAPARHRPRPTRTPLVFCIRAVFFPTQD